MSIYPTDAYRSDQPPPSYDPLPNPSSGHGVPPRPSSPPSSPKPEGPFPSRDAPAAGRRLRSSTASASGDLSAGPVAESSESPVAATEASLYSTRKVIGWKIPDSESEPDVVKVGTNSVVQSFDGQGTSSQTQPNHAGTVQVNQKASELVNFLRTDQAIGYIGQQMNNAQSGARRNQVTNGNYLLNFYYDPISRPQPRPPPPRRQRKIKPYNRDLFLQANYKFVVLDTGSYKMELMDPDKMLQWEDIACVRYNTTSTVQCPICLEGPLCPQITSCGHIYCFPCIIRYLLMEEENRKGECWKKCPLCSTMISTKDLHTILIVHVKQLHVGDVATFTLLGRSKQSLVPSLKNQRIGCSLPSSSEDGYGYNNSFSKFILTSDVELSIRKAKSELSNWLHMADCGLVDDLEKLPYVCAAMEQLEERMKYWVEHQTYSGSPPLKNSSSASSLKDKTVHKVQSQLLSTRLHGNNAQSDASIQASTESYTSSEHEKTYYFGELAADNSLSMACSPDSLRSSEQVVLSNIDDAEENVNYKDTWERDSYTFYQAADGQHLILHPLNMKCLLHQYGSYEMLPPRISGKVLELETVTQTEAIRRRYRYLSHFSLTTTFQLCEIDLSDLLPPASISPFMDEIKKREKQRKRVARKEQKEREIAEVAASQASVISSDMRDFSNKNVTFTSDDFEALGGASVPSSSPPTTGERTLFSDVARLGFAAAHDSPSLKVQPAGTYENMEGMTGTLRLHAAKDMNSVSFASILASARTAEASEAAGSNGIGKKGKKPARVLLSTAGGRRC